MATDESAAEAPENLAFGRFQVLPHRRELLAFRLEWLCCKRAAVRSRPSG
jgi:hypothetical protein